MTLLEAPEVLGGADACWTPGSAPLSNLMVSNSLGAAPARSLRGAGLARLAEIERRAMVIADPAGAGLGREFRSLFSEVRDLLDEQFTELDRCLKQAYGPCGMLATSGPGDGEAQSFDRLTVAERRVFVELTKGKPNKIIAYNLSISEATVKAHVSKILKKLKVHSRNRAIALFATRAAD